MFNYYYFAFPIRSVEHMPKVDLGSKVEPSVLQHGMEYTSTLWYKDFEIDIVLKNMSVQ